MIYERALGPFIGIIFVALISGTLNLLLSGNAKFLYNSWFKDPKLIMEEISSSGAQFARGDSTEIKQVLSYKLSASERISKIKISALFEGETRILEHGVSYSASLEGYRAKLENSHYIHIDLNHGLHQDRYAMIYLETATMVEGQSTVKLELPEIEYEGTDQNGNEFFLFLPSRTREH